MRLRFEIWFGTCAVATLASAAAAITLDSLVARLPADSLAMPLRRFENEASRPREGAEAAMLLGQLHYARGEYRRAAEAFSRAAARLDPVRKTEARYWGAVSWLALGDHAQARATFDEIVAPPSPRRVDALLGTAVAWEQARRPERAYDLLQPLVRDVRGEAAPAVLEHTLRLAERYKQFGVAAIARARLQKEYPRSVEAARIGIAAAATAPVVELGPFASEPQAHTIAERARKAGFTAARPTTRGTGAALTHVVRLAEFANATEAREAAERARRELGVPAKVVAGP